MNNINLVPIQYKKALNRKWFIALGIVGAVACIGILVFLAFIPINKIKIEENKQMLLNERLMSREIENIKDLINQISSQENKKEKMQSALDAIDLPSSVSHKMMDIIIENVPKDLRINRLKVENSDGKIYITGKTKDITNIGEYVILLHNTKKFKQITYTIETKEEAGLEGWIGYHLEIQNFTVLDQDPEIEVNIEEEIGGEDIL